MRDTEDGGKMFIRPPFVQAPSACWAPGSKSRTDASRGERRGRAPSVRTGAARKASWWRGADGADRAPRGGRPRRPAEPPGASWAHPGAPARGGGGRVQRVRGMAVRSEGARGSGSTQHLAGHCVGCSFGSDGGRSLPRAPSGGQPGLTVRAAPGRLAAGDRGWPASRSSARVTRARAASTGLVVTE